MSTLLGSSVNLSIFTVSGLDKLQPIDMFQFVQPALQKFAFKDISDGIDEQSVGWVQIEDMTATGFQSPAYAYIDKSVFLSLRKDTRKVPAAVLKQEITDRTAAWMADHSGMKRPPKRTREEIKESAKAHLLCKTFPVPKVLDAVWRVDINLVYVLSASQGELDLFCDMFHKTFDGIHLCEVPPYHRALGMSTANRLLFEAVQKSNQAATDSLLDLINSNAWIGREFILWLLSGATTAVHGVSAWVEDKVALVSDNRKAVFSGPIDENLVAIRSALQEGKHASDAVIHLEDNDGDAWRLVLNAETFRMRSVKCPPARIERCDDEVSERQAAMLMRANSLRWVVSHMNAYLYEFLRSRLLSTDSHSSAVGDWLSGEV